MSLNTEEITFRDYHRYCFTFLVITLVLLLISSKCNFWYTQGNVPCHPNAKTKCSQKAKCDKNAKFNAAKIKQFTVFNLYPLHTVNK